MNRLVPVLLLSLLLLPMAVAASEPHDDLERRRVTLERMEELAGYLVLIWKASMMTSLASGHEPELETAADPESFDWTACPEISLERIRELLGPALLAGLVPPEYRADLLGPELMAAHQESLDEVELPETDGWGHRFELCLNEADPLSGRSMLGIRSPGSDGHFEDSPYRLGSLPADDTTRDLVWVDAEFITLVAPTVEAEDPIEVTMRRVTDAASGLLAYVVAEVWIKGKPETKTDEESLECTMPATEVYDWSACPWISTEQLRELLVPRFLPELPEKDGWGHELEFCVNQGDPSPRRLAVGVRSPGSDGQFEGSTYHSGPFPPDATDRDIVWMDGYYIRGPAGGAPRE